MLPIVTMSVPSVIPKDNNVVVAPQAVLTQKQNIGAELTLAFNQVLGSKAEINKKKAEAIDAYFRARKMPLEGMGKKMVEEAEKNGLDWRLLPAIAVRESTGGIHACKRVEHNFFGWGSCKIGFDSDEEAIETIARNLGGNNPNTEHHYSGKTTKEILEKYNPPSIVPNYAKKVMATMDVIGDEDLSTVMKA